MVKLSKCPGKWNRNCYKLMTSGSKEVGKVEDLRVPERGIRQREKDTGSQDFQTGA